MTKIHKTKTNHNNKESISQKFLRKRLELINLLDEEILDTKQQLNQLRDELSLTQYHDSLISYKNQHKKNEVAIQVDCEPERAQRVIVEKSPENLCRNCKESFCSSNCLNELKEFIKQIALNNQINLPTSQREDSHVSPVIANIPSTQAQAIETQKPSTSHLEEKKTTVEERNESFSKSKKPSLDTSGLAHMIIDQISSKLSSIEQNILASNERQTTPLSISRSVSPISQNVLSHHNNDLTKHCQTGSSSIETNYHTEPISEATTAKVSSKQEDAYSKEINELMELEKLLVQEETQYLDLPEKRPHYRNKPNRSIPFAEPQSDQFKRDISLKMFHNQQNDLFPFRMNHLNDSSIYKSLPTKNDKEIHSQNDSFSEDICITDEPEMDREQFWNNILNQRNNSFGEITFS